MLQNVLLSINAVGPILLLVLLGRLLRKKGAIDEPFVTKASKLAYGYSLPLSLFRTAYLADKNADTNIFLIGYVVLSIVIATVLLCLLVPRFIKDKKRCSAFIQAAFRSNFAILGSSMAVHIFGSEGALPTLMMIPIAVTTFTVCSIVVFTIFSPDAKLNVWEILKKVLTNPLIWGNAAGLLLRALSVPVPTVIMNTVGYIAALAIPLALIAIGGQSNKEGETFASPAVLACTGIKLVLMPFLCLLPALLLGFTGSELGAVFLVHCAPTGVSAYAMAMGMKSDYTFSGKVIATSTVLSFVTIFVGILVLSTLGVFARS